MEGISRALATGPHIDLCGEQVRVCGRLLRHLGEMEAEIIYQRMDPMYLVSGVAREFAGDKEAGKSAIETAFREAKTWGLVGADELAQWMQTWRGKCFSVYLAVRDNNPAKYTLDYVTRIVSDHYEDLTRKGGQRDADDWLECIMRAIRQASGDDDLGNSTGGLPSPLVAAATECTGESGFVS